MNNKNKEKVLNIMRVFDNLSDGNYRLFELALVLYLRSDEYVVSELDNDTLYKIDKLVYDSDTLMSDSLMCDIDNILMESD